MVIATTHALHLKQATPGLIRIIMSTLLDVKKSAPGVWKLGQEIWFFLFARLRCIAVDAKRGLCVIASSSREVSC